MHKHLGYYNTPSMHMAYQWLIRIFCYMTKIKTGIADTYTTDVNLVMNQHPLHDVCTHARPDTYTCQTSGCQHVFTPRLCWQVDRTEGQRERDVVK